MKNQFIEISAEEWNYDRGPSNHFSTKWAGPFDLYDVTVESQMSALDAFNAAMPWDV